jgi:hypothetical protein
MMTARKRIDRILRFGAGIFLSGAILHTIIVVPD